MKHLISTCIFFLCLAGCDSHDPPVLVGEPFRFDDEHKNAFASKKLAEQGVKFQRDGQGFFYYEPDYHAEVLGVLRSIRTNDTLRESNHESLLLLSDEQRFFFEEELHKAGIPFFTHEDIGDLHLSWSEVYGTKVDQIREEYLIRSVAKD